jgi:hypothetical protein
MAPWTFDIKFPYGTQGSTPKLLVPVYGQVAYLLVSPSTSGGACSGLTPYAGSYHCATKTTQGIPIGAPIFQPSVGTSSSSTSAAYLDQDSTEGYPKIRGSTCWNSTDEGHLIIMVALAKAHL